jgi:hypothetical protein
MVEGAVAAKLKELEERIEKLEQMGHAGLEKNLEKLYLEHPAPAAAPAPEAPPA